MGNEVLSTNTLSESTMKQVGFTAEEIDQARKPEGLVQDGVRYIVPQPIQNRKSGESK